MRGPMTVGVGQLVGVKAQRGGHHLAEASVGCTALTHPTNPPFADVSSSQGAQRRNS